MAVAVSGVESVTEFAACLPLAEQRRKREESETESSDPMRFRQTFQEHIRKTKCHTTN